MSSTLRIFDNIEKYDVVLSEFLKLKAKNFDIKNPSTEKNKLTELGLFFLSAVTCIEWPKNGQSGPIF